MKNLYHQLCIFCTDKIDGLCLFTLNKSAQFRPDEFLGGEVRKLAIPDLLLSKGCEKDLVDILMLHAEMTSSQVRLVGKVSLIRQTMENFTQSSIGKNQKNLADAGVYFFFKRV